MARMRTALALALALAGAPAGTGRVVERVVAVVRNPADAPPRPITLTKLVEEARIALVGRGAVEAAFRPLDAEALRAALDWLVDQMLVADEATRLGLDEVDREALLAELRRFRARFGSETSFARFLAESEIAEEDLVVALERGLRVQRYLESRAGRWARVTEEEVDRYLAERGAGRVSAAARDAVRAHLVEQKAAAQVKQLLSDLRGRAEVRVLPPPPEEGR
jgi:hypothetical protein